jgi:hypothetical protein
VTLPKTLLSEMRRFIKLLPHGDKVHQYKLFFPDFFNDPPIIEVEFLREKRGETGVMGI